MHSAWCNDWENSRYIKYSVLCPVPLLWYPHTPKLAPNWSLGFFGCWKVDCLVTWTFGLWSFILTLRVQRDNGIWGKQCFLPRSFTFRAWCSTFAWAGQRLRNLVKGLCSSDFVTVTHLNLRVQSLLLGISDLSSSLCASEPQVVLAIFAWEILACEQWLIPQQ